MIEVRISKEILEKSKIRSKKIGIYSNSAGEGEGMLAGVLGEEIVSEYFKTSLSNTFDYDIIINGLKCDVKTMTTRFNPYKNDINNYWVRVTNPNQKNDLYIFVFIDITFNYAYLIGWLEHDLFRQQAVFRNKGDFCHGFNYKWSCYEVPVSILKHFPIIKV